MSETLRQSITRLRNITQLTQSQFPSDTEWLDFISQAARIIQNAVLNIDPRACQLLTWTFGLSASSEAYPIPSAVKRVVGVYYFDPTDPSTPKMRREVYPVDGADRQRYAGRRIFDLRSPFSYTLKEVYPQKLLLLMPPPQSGPFPSALQVECVPELPQLHTGQATSVTASTIVMDNPANPTFIGQLRQTPNAFRGSIVRITGVSGAGAAGLGAFGRVRFSNADTRTLTLENGWLSESPAGGSATLLTTSGSVPIGPTGILYQIEPPLQDSWWDTVLHTAAKLALSKDADSQQRIPLLDGWAGMSLEQLTADVRRQHSQATSRIRDVIYGPYDEQW